MGGYYGTRSNHGSRSHEFSKESISEDSNLSSDGTGATYAGKKLMKSAVESIWMIVR